MIPFVLIIIDHDTRDFCVEGPMMNDNSWNSAVYEIQQTGRKVSCFVPGGREKHNVEQAAVSYEQEKRYNRVVAGSIVPSPAL